MQVIERLLVDTGIFPIAGIDRSVSAGEVGGVIDPCTGSGVSRGASNP